MHIIFNRQIIWIKNLKKKRTYIIIHLDGQLLVQSFIEFGIDFDHLSSTKRHYIWEISSILILLVYPTRARRFRFARDPRLKANGLATILKRNLAKVSPFFSNREFSPIGSIRNSRRYRDPDDFAARFSCLKWLPEWETEACISWDSRWMTCQRARSQTSRSDAFIIALRT